MHNMQIYTGYFAGFNKGIDYPNPISIAASTPKWWIDRGFQKATWLAPRAEWFWDWKKKVDDYMASGGYSEDELKADYEKKYFNTVIGRMSPSTMVSLLLKDVFAADRGITLVCYESPVDEDDEFVDGYEPKLGVDFCHRFLLARYIRSGGYECKEYRER